MVEPPRWIELSDGDEFAGYRIEQRLGRGGMGILYLALEPGLERRVALKLIAPEAATDEVFARRFAEESRIAASIEHPNVVPIYAAGEERGVPWIAMRYVAGSDLGRRIAREGRLDPAEAVALIAQVGNGLDAIHAAGLIHRDVKPPNVLLGGDPGSEHAYITDFGVARNIATESGLTQTGRFVGTLDYVAPEQISGEPIDARVDVYALGCLLFKLLTGEVPFPREGEAARLYAHLNDPPPAPSLYATAVPAALDDVVARAMSKSPGDRYPSAGDLGRAAQAALSGTAISIPERTVATGAAATKETRKLPEEPVEPPRNRRPFLIGGVLALIAAAIVVVLVASGGDGGGGGAETSPLTTTTQEVKEKPDPKPRLSRSALIAQADQICAEARSSYEASKDQFPDGETEAGMSAEFAQQLVENSSRQVSRMSQLNPPKGKEDEFREYLRLRKDIARMDQRALDAAKEGNPTAYVQTYESRSPIDEQLQRVSGEIGFDVCSNNS
ncbi:MAG TPA: serine/threonine-protein kinase [Solirubrobacterales bacterium]|nr:serine/threonine-protein kinase [Solirubrobacterales bacterium]